VDGELATAVPGIKAVDAQFAELSRQSAGLQRGSQVLDGGKTAIRPAELVDEMVARRAPRRERKSVPLPRQFACGKVREQRSTDW
jgi:hypothetical protein